MYNEALKRLEEAKKLYLWVEDQRSQAHCIRSMGEIKQSCGQNDEALKRLAEAKELYLRVEDQFGQAHCIHSMGEIERCRGQLEEALVLLERAKELYLVVEDWHGLAHCIHSIGEIEQHRGQIQEAMKQFEEARRVYLRVEGQHGEARCLHSMGEIERHRGQIGNALRHFEEARELFLLVGDQHSEAHSIRSIGEVEQHRGRIVEAVQWLEKAMEVYLLVEDQCGEAHCIRGMGEIKQHEGQFEEALIQFEKAMKLYLQVEDWHGQAHCNRGMGEIKQHQGQFEEALIQFEKAMKLYLQVEDWHGQAHCNRGVGQIKQHQGQFEKALIQFEKAMKLYLQVEDRHGQAHCVRGTGEIQQHRGQTEEAQKLFEEARKLYLQVEDRHGAADCIRRVGEIEQHRGQFEEALKQFEEAMKLYLLVDDWHSAACCLCNMGEIEQLCWRNEKALKWFEEAKQLYGQLEDWQMAANCIRCMGEIEQHQGRVEEAVKLLKEAMGLYLLAGDLHGKAHCICSMGEIEQHQGRIEEAVKLLEEAMGLYLLAGDLHGEAHCIRSIGQIERHCGRNKQALKLFEKADRLGRGHEDVYTVTRRIHTMAKIAHVHRCTEVAISRFKEAKGLYLDLKDVKGQLNCLEDLGSVYIQDRQFLKAVKVHEEAIDLSRKVSRHCEAIAREKMVELLLFKLSKYTDVNKELEYARQLCIKSCATSGIPFCVGPDLTACAHLISPTAYTASLHLSILPSFLFHLPRSIHSLRITFVLPLRHAYHSPANVSSKLFYFSLPSLLHSFGNRAEQDGRADLCVRFDLENVTVKFGNGEEFSDHEFQGVRSVFSRTFPLLSDWSQAIFAPVASYSVAKNGFVPITDNESSSLVSFHQAFRQCMDVKMVEVVILGSPNVTKVWLDAFWSEEEATMVLNAIGGLPKLEVVTFGHMGSRQWRKQEVEDFMQRMRGTIVQLSIQAAEDYSSFSPSFMALDSRRLPPGSISLTLLTYPPFVRLSLPHTLLEPSLTTPSPLPTSMSSSPLPAHLKYLTIELTGTLPDGNTSIPPRPLDSRPLNLSRLKQLTYLNLDGGEETSNLVCAQFFRNLKHAAVIEHISIAYCAVKCSDLLSFIPWFFEVQRLEQAGVGQMNETSEPVLRVLLFFGDWYQEDILATRTVMEGCGVGEGYNSSWVKESGE
ncbi:TPR-like protein [Atractiella rhizophila]|nr:TPR-like protein [Atractiella rhizophila]